MLQLCDVEQGKDTLIIRTRSDFFTGLLRSPDVIEHLRSHYHATSISIETDTSLAALTSPDPEPAPTKVTPVLKQQTSTSVYVPRKREFQYFHLDDFLAPKFREKYRITEANRAAYDAVKERVKTFPESPQKEPVMILGNVGQGKTHLMQHFALHLHHNILLAQELSESKDLTSARELLGLPDASDAEVMEVLKKAAASRIRYITAEELASEHKHIHPAVWVEDGRQKADNFSRERDEWYFGVKYLFLDDIQGFAKGEKKSTLEWTYKLVDRFLLEGFALVSASDTDLMKLEKKVKPSLENDVKRLFSRLRSGGVIHLAPPSAEELVAVFMDHLRKDGVAEDAVPKDSLAQLSQSVDNYRDAVGAANATISYVSTGLNVEDAIKQSVAFYQKLRNARPPHQNELFSK